MSVRHFTSDDADWYQYRDREIFVGDVLNSSNSEAMSVGFYRNKFKGERNEWVVTYDEALICTKGALTVRSPEGTKAASSRRTPRSRSDFKLHHYQQTLIDNFGLATKICD